MSLSVRKLKETYKLTLKRHEEERIAMAVGLSTAFSKPLSEFAPFILTSTFVLFVGWEFKSS